MTLGPPCNIRFFFVCVFLLLQKNHGHQGAHCKSRLPNVGLGDPWRVLKVRIVRLADHQLLVFGDGHPIFDREPLLGFETVWCEKVPNIYSKHYPKWWLKPWWWIPWYKFKINETTSTPAEAIFWWPWPCLLLRKTGERIRICPGKWTFCTPSHGGLVQMMFLFT